MQGDEEGRVHCRLSSGPGVRARCCHCQAYAPWLPHSSQASDGIWKQDSGDLYSRSAKQSMGRNSNHWRRFGNCSKKKMNVKSIVLLCTAQAASKILLHLTGRSCPSQLTLQEKLDTTSCASVTHKGKLWINTSPPQFVYLRVHYMRSIRDLTQIIVNFILFIAQERSCGLSDATWTTNSRGNRRVSELLNFSLLFSSVSLQFWAFNRLHIALGSASLSCSSLLFIPYIFDESKVGTIAVVNKSIDVLASIDLSVGLSIHLLDMVLSRITFTVCWLAQYILTDYFARACLQMSH